MSRTTVSYRLAATSLRGGIRAITKLGKRGRVIIQIVLCLLAAVAGSAMWHARAAKPESLLSSGDIGQLEASLRMGEGNYEELGRLISVLAFRQNRARDLQLNLLYQLGLRNSEQDFVERQIQLLMAEFGAEQVRIPPEFVQRVTYFIGQYQLREREVVARALGPARKDLEAARAVLKQNHLPPDLVFMAVVESDFLVHPISREGAVGLWQFRTATARECGMKVNDKVDERLNPLKSTHAACRYLRRLILDFGAGSSVMLALAAYNAGPEKVRDALKSVRDPIRQRNFWHLYKVRALPPETRQYVPKVFAAMIVGRNPQRFGFAE